jgi:hypothetical protein
VDEVGRVLKRETETIVKIKIVGDFLGSPLHLPVSFTLDRGKIQKIFIPSSDTVSIAGP